ncbi:MAG: DNA-processing protein DprA [Clostridia bacterium]|nr:DNA-processing protein DprA [Clostridia bacterium]
MTMITSWLRIHYTLGGRAAFLPMYEKYPDPQALCRALENRAEERGIMRLIAPERFFAYDEAQARATEQLCRENGWRIVPFTSEYYPALLKKIKDPPAVLFAYGDLAILKNPRMAAVVGTRTAARRSADAAVLLGEALSLAGVAVVSGGANGIDSAASYGAALAESAGSVTVQGRGFDPAHDAEAPAPNAVYVTELFPGLSGRAFNFPNRNRLISGMSAGTAVLEAGGKSGSLITARDAMKQGRPVFVPASALLQSPGCAALAASGAKEIVRPQDCIGALFPELPASEASLTPLDEAPVGRYEQSFYGLPVRAAKGPAADDPVAEKPAENLPAEPPRSPAVGTARTAVAALPGDLSRDARVVAEAVRNGPLYVDQLIETLGLSAAEVQIAVTELELEGLILVAPGGKIVWNNIF